MRVHLSLGSNLGDRMRNLQDALDRLDGLHHVRVVNVSDCYETEPVGVVDQPAFLNAAAEIETDLAPLELLDAVKAVEVELGRVPAVRWGPRLIDIDIVLWGDRLVREARLEVPHPAFRRRAFVLVPFAEIAPQAVDPVTGKTIGELAESPGGAGRVYRLGPLRDR
jgi:2-amino-4-hydroxy-6-hydroxymethyldihydropteridine diphosphokinase